MANDDDFRGGGSPWGSPPRGRGNGSGKGRRKFGQKKRKSRAKGSKGKKGKGIAGNTRF